MNVSTQFTLVLSISLLGLSACGGVSNSSNKSSSVTPSQSEVTPSQSDSDSFVKTVKTGTIGQYPYVPIGKAFDATFAAPTWKSGESEKGMKFVEFRGRFQKVALEKSRTVYQECVGPRNDVAKLPVFSFVYAIGHYGIPVLSTVSDARTNQVRGAYESAPYWWGHMQAWQGLMHFAEQNKGNEPRDS